MSLQGKMPDQGNRQETYMMFNKALRGSPAKRSACQFQYDRYGRGMSTGLD